MTGTIYIIKNKINSKVYIGKTFSSLDKRFAEHKRDSLKYADRVLYRAFNKYGLDNFFIEELEKVSDEKIEEREIFYIKKYNSYIGFSNSNGYNSTLGGDGKKYFAFSDEEVIEKYRELKYISYVANFFKASEDTIRKILKSNQIEKTNKGEHSKKRVLMFLDDREILSFNSIKETAEYLLNNNLTKTKDLKYVIKGVSRVVNGSSKTYQGFVFKEAI